MNRESESKNKGSLFVFNSLSGDRIQVLLRLRQTPQTATLTTRHTHTTFIDMINDHIITGHANDG
jgi:hypothetical protein